VTGAVALCVNEKIKLVMEPTHSLVPVLTILRSVIKADQQVCRLFQYQGDTN